MAEVSLDGLQVELAHALDLQEALRRIEDAARDLSQGSLKNQNPVVSVPDPTLVMLSGRSARGSHFEARIQLEERRVLVQIKGALALTMLEMTFAGGSAGVRRRVQAEVERALVERFETP